VCAKTATPPLKPCEAANRGLTAHKRRLKNINKDNKRQMEMKKMYVRPLVEVIAITPENGVCDVTFGSKGQSGGEALAPGRKDFGGAEMETENLDAMQRGSSFELEDAGQRQLNAWE